MTDKEMIELLMKKTDCRLLFKDGESLEYVDTLKKGTVLFEFDEAGNLLRVES